MNADTPQILSAIFQAYPGEKKIFVEALNILSRISRTKEFKKQLIEAEIVESLRIAIESLDELGT